jgi:broad specificity phosphatase PhoE
MAANTRLLLIRHGESVLGRARRYAGHRDTPLTPEGRRQILRLRSRFERLLPDLVFSSDLRRCRESAALLAPGRDVRVTVRLRELDFGVWDGLTAATCRRRDPERFDRWMADPDAVRPPGGESLRALGRRVRDYVAALARRHPGQTLALVTHAGPIRVLVAGGASEFWSARVAPGSLLELEWKGGATG